MHAEKNIKLFPNGLSYMIPYFTGLYAGYTVSCVTVLCIRYRTQVM